MPRRTSRSTATEVNRPALDSLFTSLKPTHIFDQPGPRSPEDTYAHRPAVTQTHESPHGTGKSTTPNSGAESRSAQLRPRPIALDSVNWDIAYQIRRRVSTDLSEQLRQESERPGGRAISEDDRRQMGRRLIPNAVRAHREEAMLESRLDAQINAADIDHYIRAVDSAMFGYGRWQPLMEDTDFENLEIRGDKVFMVYPDRIERVAPVADNDAELIEQLTYLATYSPTPKPFSRTHPEMTLNLEDRYRLHAIAFDVIDRPSIVIRQHKFTAADLRQLSSWGMMPTDVAQFLAAAVRARRSMVVSGDQGAGKTTFLRALAMAMDPLESVGVIETDAELFLHKLPGRDRIINMIGREGSGEGVGADGRPLGEYNLHQHFIAAVRQNLRRIIVGEVRGSEAPAMFQAMQSGAGSLSTIHSQHAAATVERLVTAAALGGLFTQQDAYRQIAVNIHLVIHLDTADQRSTGGRLDRFVSEITEINGFSDQHGGGFLPAVNTVYTRDEQHLRTEMMSEPLKQALRTSGWHEPGLHP